MINMRKLRLYLVENDPDEQEFMKEAFMESGQFELVGVGKSGDVLFEWLDQGNPAPDFVLSDLNMPGKNGHDILNELTSSDKYPRIPVVITSTSSTPFIIDRCMKEGATAYIVKPETFARYVPFVSELYGRLIEVIEAKPV
jgi:DNA-binding NarL/FixJ family response regulator